MNSDLKDRVYEIPQNILEFIKNTYDKLSNKNVRGVERAKTLLNEKKVTYGQLKRIIHDIKTLDKLTEKTKFELYGGDLMEIWANKFLDGERKFVKDKKHMSKVSNDIGQIDRKNPYLKGHEKKEKFDISLSNLGKADETLKIGGLFEEIKRIKHIIKY